MNPEQQQASPDRSSNEAAMGTLFIVELLACCAWSWVIKPRSWVVSVEGLQEWRGKESGVVDNGGKKGG
nr:hypothetical protein [Tanacetum cinerariifolium]